MKKKLVVVIDGQGGLLGRQLSDQILEKAPDAEVQVIGTNSIATANMLKGKAKRGATGENPVLVACRRADIITGPIGLIITDAMMGEITEEIASAITRSDALKVLIPISRCGVEIAGTEELPMGDLIEDTVSRIVRALQNETD
ncbi:MAG: DUF3842 family protein [Solobacterium sp.]|nr:DUF3842 family protein [Solobacterium sp.]MCH4265912.1 DUF3842 family protein [Solobacterium sp.]